MYKRMFTKGRPYTDLIDVVRAIASREYIYWHDKPMHHGWMGSQHLFTLMSATKNGHLSHAHPTSEYFRRRLRERESQEMEERQSSGETGADPNP